MKGKTQRVDRKIKLPTTQKRKTPPKVVDKFASDIPGKEYIHDLTNPDERKNRTGVGFEIKGEEGFTPYKKMNKNTNRVEVVIFESVEIAKIYAKTFTDRNMEIRIALFVNGNKLCNLNQSYIDDNKVIRAFSSNKGHHVFYQDLSWKMINTGYIKMISNKFVAKEDMNNFNIDGIDALKAHIYDLVAEDSLIRRVIDSEEDMIIFEVCGVGVYLRGMLMTNRALIKKNSNRRNSGLRAFTFDQNSSKNTDFYLTFYTLPVKWYLEPMQEIATQVIEQLVNFETELVGSHCKTSYYPINVHSGITFNEEEVKG